MKSFHVSSEIDAPPSRVWALLSDVEAWPAWNTTVERVVGSATLGGKVTVYAKASPGRAFPLSVSVFEPPRSMVWTGGMPLGLFVGTRTYTLGERGAHGTRFEMKEEFGGLLAPLITRSIPDLQPAFLEFARCLKAAAERA